MSDESITWRVTRGRTVSSGSAVRINQEQKSSWLAFGAVEEKGEFFGGWGGRRGRMGQGLGTMGRPRDGVDVGLFFRTSVSGEDLEIL